MGCYPKNYWAFHWWLWRERWITSDEWLASRQCRSLETRATPWSHFPAVLSLLVSTLFDFLVCCNSPRPFHKFLLGIIPSLRFYNSPFEDLKLVSVWDFDHTLNNIVLKCFQQWPMFSPFVAAKSKYFFISPNKKKNICRTKAQKSSHYII